MKPEEVVREEKIKENISLMRSSINSDEVEIIIKDGKKYIRRKRTKS